MSQAQIELDHLWKRGRELLGSRYAIMGGAMTWVSERQLVSAISNAGGFGVIACGAMSPDLLNAEIKATQQLTQKSFGVNLITLHPQLNELLETCIATKVTHVVLAGGVPSKEAIEKLKKAGIKVLCFAPAYALAKRLMRLDIDGLIIEGNEAGGHIGPVSTSVLAQEILPHIREIPIFVAGGIGRGDAMLSYLEMGASGCQLGTRFVCAVESRAHPNFKKAFIKASARDAVASVQLDSRFPVIPVRALVNNGSQRFMKLQQELVQCVDRGELEPKEAQLQIEHFWAGALRRAVIEGDIEEGSLMAGQSVGMVTAEEPTAKIIEDIIQQALQKLEERKNNISQQGNEKSTTFSTNSQQFTPSLT
jgi:enoyl-[acyl-carrier protein] reductase II